ncbi:hypothetical protein SAMN05428642_103314 [Flaviramulus basaltis]|uniref:Tetratricopeptide repeat-containing protein n=1 Tax=Flaviramulus basaltis TaxID=369401 RepID=A0A1K2INB5_9FLAO|nr:tetratricopeptide repeat protein [Flaviramulus basaltis]SFZ93754.1 hypothetical protein SAMN05428642_103314 [Flaviramulus basaltis]
MENNNDIPKELFEAIERYINGTMKPDELKDFNDYLKIDSEFKKQVEDIKTMLLAKETKSLKEDSKPSTKDLTKTKTTKTPAKVRLLKSSKIALVAAIIIALGSIWYFSNSPNQKLYSKYFKPATELPEINIKNSSYLYEYDAMKNYKNGNYSKAIKEWQILNEQKINNDTLNYFLGIAKMANNNVPDAIPFLERCVAKNSFSLLNNAYFYLGLAYLNEGNIELAKKYISLSKNDVSEEILLKIR